ncbi:MAG: DUF4331 family protein [Myxococcota bacterium]
MTLSMMVWAATTFAADHTEAPGAAADPAADIADFYAWVDGGRLTSVITFAGLTAAGGAPTYDADVLYTIHVDNDGDNVSDVDVLVRFGQNAAGDWGVQASGLPGASGPLEGAVETTLTGESFELYAGLRDDPFFFDLAGYSDTLSTGTLSFDSTRDSFAGTNVTAIVLEGPADAWLDGGTSLNVWTTTARK